MIVAPRMSGLSSLAVHPRVALHAARPAFLLCTAANATAAAGSSTCDSARANIERETPQVGGASIFSFIVWGFRTGAQQCSEPCCCDLVDQIAACGVNEKLVQL